MPAVCLESRAWLRTVARRGPERWSWALVGAGWLGLLVYLPSHGGARPDPTLGMADMPRMPGVAGSGVVADDAADPFLAWSSELGLHLLMWAAMVLATMLPLVVWNLRQIGLRSPRLRRTSATCNVVAGWLLVWLGAGIVVCTAALLALRSISYVLIVAVIVAAAVAWQPTRMKRVAVARCHRTFAPPLGRTAGRACVRFGSTLGRDCLVACWPGMLVMTTAGHRLSVVVPLACLSWRDRRRPHDRPGTWLSAAVLLVGGVLALVPSGW